MNLDDFETATAENGECFLGRGSFSQVFLSKNIVDNKLYAIKVV